MKLVCHPQKFCCVMAVALGGGGAGRRWGGAPSVNIRRCRRKFAMARLILPHGVCKEGRGALGAGAGADEGVLSKPEK